MFSFFKKSKKESDASSNKENKDKKSKEREIKPDECVTTPQTRLIDDVCKNKIVQICENANAPSGGTIGADTGPKDIAFQQLTSDNLVYNDIETNSNDPILPNHREVNKEHLGEENSNGNNSSEVMFLFPGSPKRSPDGGGGNVKPCGHATVAVSPKVPPRAKNLTPPNSPMPDFLEKLKKKKNGDTSPHEQFYDAYDIDDVKNLINQEAKFQKQLNELNQQLTQRDADASKLRFEMEELQRDVFSKSAGIDRLQSEVQTAHKESELLRQKLKYFEDEMVRVRDRNSELVDEINSKSESLLAFEAQTKLKIAELEKVIQELNKRIKELEAQIATLLEERDKLAQEHKDILTEKEEQKKIIETALEEALKQKKEVDEKWAQEFEKLRTVSIIKEQQTLDDFEWKLREVEQSCKKKLLEKDRTLETRLQEAYKDTELKLKMAEEMVEEVKHLKCYEAEALQLRSLTQEQENSIKKMMEQQEQMQMAERSLREEAKNLKKLIDMEKDNLEHIQKLHNMEITNKERLLHRQLEEKKTEIAMYWEERLLHECGRLKNELEQSHDEEKLYAMQIARRQKDDEFHEYKKIWDGKLEESFRQIAKLKGELHKKDLEYHAEMEEKQDKTDRDIMELRRLMDKLDMTHHDNFEKLVMNHEEEIEKINVEHEKKIKEVEIACQNQVFSLRATLELVKEQMARESQQQIQTLIDQHRAELDTQWANLVHQKSEAVKLVEDEYVSKYKTLEEQFYTQQKSHESREIELLKSIDSLKNEITSKNSAVDDLQNNVDTLEGGIQVLNCTIRGLQADMTTVQGRHEDELKQYESQLHQLQKQSQTTIDHLQRKCQCLTKLFEEVRTRYEKRESRQEDINLISDLRQIIAEQEKDLTCLNEEKRYYQMKLMSVQRSIEDDEEDFVDTEDFEVVDNVKQNGYTQQTAQKQNQQQPPPQPLNPISIPPTIIECDDSDE